MRRCMAIFLLWIIFALLARVQSRISKNTSLESRRPITAHAMKGNGG
jgi:hypothetical protein